MNKNLLQNKLFLIIIATVLAAGFLKVGTNIVIDKVADKVILKLKRNYTPGPYDPGFDPDKVSPRIIKDEVNKSSILTPAEWNAQWEN